MSLFAKPEWADVAEESFFGTLILRESALEYPKEKDYYPGENYVGVSALRSHPVPVFR